MFHERLEISWKNSSSLHSSSLFLKSFHLKGNIKHSTKYLISWQFVKNTTLRIVFSTFSPCLML